MAKKQQAKTTVTEGPNFLTHFWYNIVGHPEERKIKAEKRADIKAKKNALSRDRHTVSAKGVLLCGQAAT